MRGHAPLVLRLQLVVELLVDARADLLRRRSHVEAGSEALEQTQDDAEVAHVRAHRAGHARVLHLHRHGAPVGQRGAIDLADRRGGDRILVEVGEHRRDRLIEILLDDLAHLLEGHLRGRVAQLGQLALKLLAVLLGHQADVQERQHLPELHRRALHGAQHGHDLLGRFELAPGQRLLGRVVAARDVGRARAELLDRLAGRQATHRRRAPNPGGGHLLACHGTSHGRGSVGGLGARVPPPAPRGLRRGRAAPGAAVSRYARERRWTCEPGTMSSRPSGQRTHALCPPS